MSDLMDFDGIRKTLFKFKRWRKSMRLELPPARTYKVSFLYEMDIEIYARLSVLVDRRADKTDVNPNILV